MTAPTEGMTDIEIRWHFENMLAALKRALFVLESPALLALTNGAGTVDVVRAAIAKAEGEQ